VHLFDESRIAGKTARIEIAHLFNERLQLLLCLGIILNRGANGVEEVQALVDGFLGIGRSGTLVGRHGLSLDPGIARVPGAITLLAVSVAAGRSAGNAVTDLARTALAARLTLAVLAALALSALSLLAPASALPATLGLLLATLATLPALSLLALSLLTLALLTLALLATLALLRLPAELTGLELLACAVTLSLLISLTGLIALTRLIPGTSPKSGELIAQAGEIIHRAVQRGIFGRTLGASQSFGCVADILPEFLQIARERGLRLIGEIAASQPVGTALHAGAEIVLVHAIERAAQFGGSAWLGGREFARFGAHLLGETGEIVANLLAIADHLIHFLRGGTFGLLTGSPHGILLRH